MFGKSLILNVKYFLQYDPFFKNLFFMLYFQFSESHKIKLSFVCFKNVSVILKQHVLYINTHSLR